MVLCRFFQKGTCRFGSNCYNEHFDVQQILKADVDAAISGKQWLFSCYSPFKDKPCLPNFDEDRNFEEIRLLCYEAKRKNCLEQFDCKFSKEAIEMANKMKAIYQSSDIIEVAINLYDTPSQSKTVTTPSNDSSIFSKSVVHAGNVNSGSIFGGGTPNTGNVFEQVAQQQNNSIFGQQQKTAQTSIYGRAADHRQLEQQNTDNIFAQSTQPTASVGGNIFAQPAQQTNFEVVSQAAQPETSTALTNQSPYSTNIFGQVVPTSENLQQQAPPDGFFASAATQVAATYIQQQQQAAIAFDANTLNYPTTLQMQPSQIGSTQNIDYSIYSKMEDLTADEIEAFEAPEFLPGKVPFSPPPYSLR